MAQNPDVLRDYQSRRDRLLQAVSDLQDTEAAIAEAQFTGDRCHGLDSMKRDLEWLQLKKAAAQRRLDRLVVRLIS